MIIGYANSMFTATHGILARATSGGGYTNTKSILLDGIDELYKGCNYFILSYGQIRHI
jgi:hypothetical protein